MNRSTKGIYQISSVLCVYSIEVVIMVFTNSSRKMFIAIFALLMIVSLLPIVPSGNGSAGTGSDVELDPASSDDQVLKGEDFTHSVLLELFVTTWCDRCPTSEEASTELSMEYGDNFHYVSMVCDEVDEADQRSEDYAVETYPTAIFDGGDEDDRASENDSSSQSDKERYEEHIESCGNRDVSATPVALSVDVTDQGDGVMGVSYSATFTGSSQWFDCHIRVYVTERESRFPNIDDEPIPYGFLSYAFDEDLRLLPQVEQTDTTNVDTDGGDFDNIVIVAGIFDKRTGVEQYVVQTASTEIASSVIFTDVEHVPEDPDHNEDVTVSCEAMGDFEDIWVEVAPCTADACNAPYDVTMESDEDGSYFANIGSFDGDITIVHYWIRTEDSGGQKSKSAQYDIEFGGSGNDDDSSNIMMYGGGAVLVLGVAFAILFISKNKPNEELDDGVFGPDQDQLEAPVEESEGEVW